MSRLQRWWMGIVAVLTAALGAVAVAWACTPTADMTIDPGSARAGMPVTITGTGFDQGIVEIRMDSTSSAPLATAQGPSFSVTLTVPETSPGYHTFGAVGYNAEGVAVGEASVPFEVTAEESAPAQSVAPTVPRQSSPPAAGGKPVSGALERAPRAERPRADREPVRASAPAAVAPAAEIATAPLAADSATAAPAREARPPRAAAGAPRPFSALARVGRVELIPPAPERGRSPADPWQARSSAADQDSAGPGGQIAIGAGLLAVGLVALFGGFAVAELRRRRALAGARRTP